MPRGTSRFDEAQHQRRLWTPAHLNVRSHAWYSAQDLATITGASGQVSQWNDKSGNARHLSQATGGVRPDLTASGLNGRPCLTFSGTDQIFTFSFGFTGGAISAAAFVVATLTADPSPTNAALVSSAASGAPDWALTTGARFIGYAAGVDLFRVAANGGDIGTGIAVPAATPMQLASFYDVSAPTWELSKNGTSSGAVAAGYTANWNATEFRIGCAPDGVEAWPGLVGEVLVLAYLPSSRDRLRIEGYLAHGWGLAADLPASHAFKNRPPLIGD